MNHRFYSKQVVKSQVTFSLSLNKGHHDKHWVNEALNPKSCNLTLGAFGHEALREFGQLCCAMRIRENWSYPQQEVPTLYILRVLFSCQHFLALPQN